MPTVSVAARDGATGTAVTDALGVDAASGGCLSAKVSVCGSACVKTVLSPPAAMSQHSQGAANTIY